MYNIELLQSFASNLNEKCHQVALLVRKAESKHENENISTGESLSGVPGVSRNQKLSTKYEFCSFKVSLGVLIYVSNLEKGLGCAIWFDLFGGGRIIDLLVEKK